jgi:hypothetical protein
MKLKLPIPAIAVAIFLLPSFALAAASPSSTLRSAYLQRQVGELQPLDRRENEEIREDLQTHFDAVLELLEKHSDISLQVALIRLEKQQGVRWTAKQRDYWRTFLTEQRALNMQRLIAYRDRGLFPQNEGHSLKAVPIFVDRHDTACAVGHLMRESGWEREVNLIEATNLFVYVTDVNDGPLVHWVLQSGLTQEEATLIQPGYPFEYEHLVSDFSSPGSSHNSYGLDYSEFSMSASGPLGLRFGRGYYESQPFGYPDVDPVGTHWMVVGGEGLRSDAFLYNADNQYVRLKFRVSASNPNTFINQISLQTDYFENGFRLYESPGFGDRPLDRNDPDYVRYMYGYYIEAEVTNLTTLQQTTIPFWDEFIDEPGYGVGNGVLTQDLSRGNDFEIEITSYFGDFSTANVIRRIMLGSYVVDFNVVPEPTNMASVSLGLVALGLFRTLRNPATH